jgi:hypothetical protein
METAISLPETDQDDYLDAQTRTLECGCGKIYVIINTNGDFHSITIKGSMVKEAPCGEAWFNAMSGILTFALRRAIREDENALYKGIIKQLKGQSCNNVSVSRKSCIHQISVVLEDYLKTREKKETTKT